MVRDEIWVGIRILTEIIIAASQAEAGAWMVPPSCDQPLISSSSSFPFFFLFPPSFRLSFLFSFPLLWFESDKTR